jgi:hypothetical protein
MPCYYSYAKIKQENIMNLPSVQNTQNLPCNCNLSTNIPKNEIPVNAPDLIFKILQFITENKIGMSLGILSCGLGLYKIFDIQTEYAHLFSGKFPLLSEPILISVNLVTATHVGWLAQRLFNQYQKGTNHTNVLKTTSEFASSYVRTILPAGVAHLAATYALRSLFA